jgi:hypothetical protein
MVPETSKKGAESRGYIKGKAFRAVSDRATITFSRTLPQSVRVPVCCGRQPHVALVEALWPPSFCLTRQALFPFVCGPNSCSWALPALPYIRLDDADPDVVGAGNWEEYEKKEWQHQHARLSPSSENWSRILGDENCAPTSILIVFSSSVVSGFPSWMWPCRLV